MTDDELRHRFNSIENKQPEGCFIYIILFIILFSTCNIRINHHIDNTSDKSIVVEKVEKI